MTPPSWGFPISIPTIFIPTKVGIKMIGIETFFIEKQSQYLPNSEQSRNRDSRYRERFSMRTFSIPTISMPTRCWSGGCNDGRYSDRTHTAQ